MKERTTVQWSSHSECASLSASPPRITPFNLPAMVLWMFPIAIACGNAFVRQPSERAPVGARCVNGRALHR